MAHGAPREAPSGGHPGGAFPGALDSGTVAFFGGGGRILRRHTHWLSAAGVIRRHCGLGADGSKAAAHPGRGGSQRPGAPTCEETQSHGREPAVASRTPRKGGRRQLPDPEKGGPATVSPALSSLSRRAGSSRVRRRDGPEGEQKPVDSTHPPPPRAWEGGRAQPHGSRLRSTGPRT